MYIPEEVIEKIKQTSAVDIIGEYVQLIKRGKNYVGLCPFHNEKTPSFTVFDDKNFKCFGCGKSGDVISFIQEMENCSFSEAVEILAKKLNIQFSPDSHEPVKNYFYDINRDAAYYFMNNLFSNKLAQNYLVKRKIDVKSVKRFGIGYALDKWDDLYKYLLNKGYKKEAIIESEVLSYSEKISNYYDAFRDRIVFPLIDISGKVVGFSGRTISDKEPKYYNSRDSKYFKKGDLLFGLYQMKLRKNIQDQNKDKILLVEGNLDVVKLHQAGIDFAVASLGTSFTERQAQLIKRFGKEVYLCLDGDAAGIKATLRNIEILLTFNVFPKVITLPDNMDPDNFIDKYGKEAFYSLIYTSKDGLSILADHLKEEINKSGRIDFTDTIDRVSNLIATISENSGNIQSLNLIKYFSEKFNIDERFIENKVRNKVNLKKEDVFVERVANKDHDRELLLINFILTDKVNFNEIEKYSIISTIETQYIREIYKMIKSEYLNSSEIVFEEFLKKLKDNKDIPEHILDRIRKLNIDSIQSEKMLNELISGFRNKDAKKTQNILRQRFNEIKENKDDNSKEELMKILELMDKQNKGGNYGEYN